MKIAIIGAGVAGLACAHECERLGVTADLYERNDDVGWPWMSVDVWLSHIERKGPDIIEYLKDDFGIYIRPVSPCKKIIIKSPGREAVIQGNLGYLVPKGTIENSFEKQIKHALRSTSIIYNKTCDFKELSGKYDYVVVATGNDAAARELGVWEDFGQVHVIEALVTGTFDESATTVFFNTKYFGSGYGRIVPLRPNQAMVGLANIGAGEFDKDRLFALFLKEEGLSNLEIVFKVSQPEYSNGRVKKCRVGNILLAGRAAGLVERFMGFGDVNAVISGVLAARSMIKNMDYEALIKPVQDHVENISSFRIPFEKIDNDGLDRLVLLIDTPVVKQMIYSSRINIMDLVGGMLKRIYR